MGGALTFIVTWRRCRTSTLHMKSLIIRVIVSLLYYFLYSNITLFEPPNDLNYYFWSQLVHKRLLRTAYTLIRYVGMALNSAHAHCFANIQLNNRNTEIRLDIWLCFISSFDYQFLTKTWTHVMFAFPDSNKKQNSGLFIYFFHTT